MSKSATSLNDSKPNPVSVSSAWASNISNSLSDTYKSGSSLFHHKQLIDPNVSYASSESSYSSVSPILSTSSNIAAVKVSTDRLKKLNRSF